MDISSLVEWVCKFYDGVKRTVVMGGVKRVVYGSSRGFFRHSSALNEIIEDEFEHVDFKVWNRVLINVKSGHSQAKNGGLFFRYVDYEHLCSKRSWYTCRKKFLRIGLLIETPFKDYYILNPKYIVKLYGLKSEETDKNS